MTEGEDEPNEKKGKEKVDLLVSEDGMDEDEDAVRLADFV